MVERKTGIPRLLEITKSKQTLMIISAFFAMISSIVAIFPYVSIYNIIKEVMMNAQSPLASDVELIKYWGLVAIGSIIGSLIILYISSVISHYAAYHILYDLRIKLTEHLAKLPMGYHTNNSTGKTKKTVEGSVEKIENFIAHQIPDVLSSICAPFIMIIFFFFMDWRLAIITLIPILISFYIQSNVYKAGSKESMINYHNALEEMNSAGIEYVRGMPAIKVFRMSVNSFTTFKDAIMSYREYALDITAEKKKPYTMFLVALSSIATFIIPIGIMVLANNPDDKAFALTFIAFVIIAPSISAPLLKITYLGGSLRDILEGVRRMDEIFDEVPLKEPLNPKRLTSYDIEFNHVSFSYETIKQSDTKQILNDISFIARENEVTALVGPSGGGKSTIAGLIPRFWDIDEGSITIGDINVKDIGTKNLMKDVSFVFQDIHLFFDTIEENIRMGNDEVCFEKVKEAAQIACCDAFINELSEGYQTKIGDGGTYLSGGEQQRIAIARAILKNAPILILDEATAYADPENEYHIQKGLNSLVKNKTVIIIAHRLSTIKNANKIIVIKDGEINDYGKHDELVLKDGLYKKMWDAHNDADNWQLNKKGVN